MRKPGKKIHRKVYAHRDYEEEVVPKYILEKAKEYAGKTIKGYTSIRFDLSRFTVAFQFCDDFDTSDEPSVGKTVTVTEYGVIEISYPTSNPYIWHHKWMWVGDGYKGFDVEASKRRSEETAKYITKENKSKIGRKSYWERLINEYQVS